MYERLPKPTGSLPSSMSTATSHDATEAMLSGVMQNNTIYHWFNGEIG
jgi:hypothetical protein